MGIEHEINRSQATVFRRAYIKRRSNTTGLYEADWLDITEYVENWGTIQNSIDAIRLNNFKHSGLSLTCRNDEGKFNPHGHVNSLWNGFMPRPRTLLKIEAGYEDDDGTELPADPTQGIFILTDNVPINAMTNKAVMQFKSLVSMFEEERAINVAGLNGTQSASDLITKIRDHTDGSGNLLFRQVISQASWVIQTTTANYNPATGTSLDGLSCWDLMNKLAEAEGYILIIDRTGQFEFRDRDERTTASQFTFYGVGFKNQNVISLNEYVEPINKYYNYYRLKYLTPDTSISYVTSGTTTTIDPSSTAWMYGVRTYDFENTLINDTTTAQTIVDNRRSQFDSIKEELKVKAKFTPQLEISDKVLFSYRSYDLAETTLWDQFNWDEAEWAGEAGEIFDWADIEFKILSKKTNLDNFTTEFILRRL
jgi:hypothetical protein